MQVNDLYSTRTTTMWTHHLQPRSSGSGAVTGGKGRSLDCILSGLGYNGVVEGQHQWDACANMKVWLFETTPLFGGTIASFNINTNAWAARSVWSWKSLRLS